jgi:hypothetical protein
MTIRRVRSFAKARISSNKYDSTQDVTQLHFVRYSHAELQAPYPAHLEFVLLCRRSPQLSLTHPAFVELELWV